MGPVTRVLVLGVTGMLGRALAAEAKRRESSVIGVARNGADINGDIADANWITTVLTNIQPDIVINSAAITSIDECERTPGQAYLVNARAAGILAEVAGRLGAYLVQISTDHLFTGDGMRAHGEAERVRLLNEYARTKYAGEQFALTNPGSLVVRTNIVGFRHRRANPTFVEWAIHSLEQQATMTLFDDYFVSSIDVGNLSSALFDLLPARPNGVLNIAARHVSSKSAFVEALANRMGLPTAGCRIGSVRSMPGTARAESLGLDVSKAEQLLGRPLPDLQGVVDRLNKEFRGIP